MAISYVGQSQTAGTSTTLPAGIIAGDIILVFAYSGSAAIPSTPTGYTSYLSAMGSNSGALIAYLTATGTESGTSVICGGSAVTRSVIYRGSSGLGAKAIFANTVNSTTVTIPALTTLDIANGTSWVVHFGASRQSTGLSAITNSTQRGTDQVGTASATVVGDTNGGVTSRAAQSSTSAASVRTIGASIEIKAIPSASTGQVKVWNGTSWANKPVKTWNGTIWNIKPVKVWNNKMWVTTGTNPITNGPTPIAALWAGDPAVSATNNSATTWRDYVGGTTMDDIAGISRRPTFILNSTNFNNNPALRFNRSSSQNLNLSFGASIFQDFYMVIILAATGPTSTTEVPIATGAGGSSGIGKSGSLNQWFIGQNTVVQSGITYTASPTLLVGTFNGASSKVTVNGVDGTIGSAGTLTASNFTVGAAIGSGTTTNPFTGDIHFAAIYQTNPTLDAKWPAILSLARSCGVSV